MKRSRVVCFYLTLLMLTNCNLTQAAISVDESAVNIKNLGRFQGWRENSITGYGIVSGLAGTGDSPTNKSTRQMLANLQSQFGVAVPIDQIQSRNVAIVIVSAMLPPQAREGESIDVVVTSTGDARSLLGGNLLSTPLRAANGKIYALAQGSLSVGGFRYDANGNIIQKNHPTTGAIPNGAIVEQTVRASVVDENHKMVFLLQEADYTTASRVAKVINSQFGECAKAIDSGAVEIAVPEKYTTNIVDFVAEFENLKVLPANRSKVIINERTGVIVAGGDAKISPISLTHGELKLNVTSYQAVSQPILLGVNNSSGIKTIPYTNSVMQVEDNSDSTYIAGKNTLAELVKTLVKAKTNPRDIISIIRAIKAAGALHADLIIQ